MQALDSITFEGLSLEELRQVEKRLEDATLEAKRQSKRLRLTTEYERCICPDCDGTGRSSIARECGACEAATFVFFRRSDGRRQERECVPTRYTARAYNRALQEVGLPEFGPAKPAPIEARNG
jgi:RecJ-like exonuclease